MKQKVSGDKGPWLASKSAAKTGNATQLLHEDFRRLAVATLACALITVSALGVLAGTFWGGTTMIHQEFDPTLPHRYARYGRMSSPRQNPSSPDQQYQSIDLTLTRTKYPWVYVKDFRDDHITGKLMRKRKGLQQMLTEIRTGILEIDLILVDTYERIGRAEEIPAMRRELEVEHGVLLLSADNNFADPTSVPGKALAVVDQIRATEEGRIKAHQVLRAKHYMAKRGYWPGGPAPLGLKLHAILTTKNGSQVIDGRKLVPDPATDWIPNLLWAKARDTGWGTLRLARWLNKHPDIPEAMKPFYPDSVGYMLDNRIYRGDLVFARNSTDIIADTRKVVRNPDNLVTVVSGFCEAIVDPALWDKVHKLRQQRSRQIKKSRAAKKSKAPKQITPLAPGLVLKHPLSGLARCGHCGRAMRPSTSGAKSGAGRTYTYYTCPGHIAHVCDNDNHVREEPLRTAVLSALRRRLFPSPDQDGDIPSWFEPFVQDVQLELDRISGGDRNETPALRAELGTIETKQKGWTQTLGNPESSPLVRREVEKHYEESIKRAAEINGKLAALEAAARNAKEIVSPARVLDGLHSLAELLERGNPTALAYELSKHIDRIDCFVNGAVEMHTVNTGLFEGLTELLSTSSGGGRSQAEDDPAARPVKHITPRRRGRLRIARSSKPSEPDRRDTSLDPARFTGLSGRFIWKDAFVMPGRRFWSSEHASEVARKRDETGWTQAKLANHFGVSRPTIRRALRIAAETKSDTTAPDAPPSRRDAESA